jgi:putative Mg2+ transporter-C (MgtC) family protein
MEHIMREVWDTVVIEFSDLSSVRDTTSMVIRLFMAALLGGLLGYEREQHGKSAGVRTHMLVALGSAMFILLPQQTGGADADLTRIQQGLVAGIGFLGAGSIIKGGNEGDVKGLTTAASIWLTAAIGMAAGMGREASAVLCTLIALMIMAILPRVIRPSEDEKRET